MAHTSVIYLIVLELSCIYVSGFLFELQPQKANADCKILFNCPTMCVGYDPMTLCPICTCGAPPASQAFQNMAPSGGQQQQYSYPSQSESASGTVQQTGTMGGNIYQMFGKWGNNNVNQGNANQLIPQGQGKNPANPNNVFPGMPLSGMRSVSIAVSSQNQIVTTNSTLPLHSTPSFTSNPLGTQNLMSPTKRGSEALTAYQSTKLSTSKPISTRPIPSKATPTSVVATLPTSGLSTSRLPSILMTSLPMYLELEKRQSVPTFFFSTISSTSQLLSSLISETKTHTTHPLLTDKITRLSSSPTSSTLGLSSKPAVTFSSFMSTSTQKPLPILNTRTQTFNPQLTQTITTSSLSSASSTSGMTKKPAPSPNFATAVFLFGSTSEQDKLVPKLAPSSPTSAPVPYVCPGVFICSVTCLTGYAIDAQGCPVCQCAEAPVVIP